MNFYLFSSPFFIPLKNLFNLIYNKNYLFNNKLINFLIENTFKEVEKFKFKIISKRKFIKVNNINNNRKYSNKINNKKNK